ncbi:sensor histidine kinase [Chryseobacterium sp. MMS23-Vi53]|uniref:sensor histidine kinase n=1 Tax=Chryseobacterium sp. MMS23-Vi53 TaxID=3386644 RepID=UPI0039EC117E
MKYFYFISLFFSLLFNAQRYTSRWYGMDQGLPQNSVKDIVKDKYGFIWLATDSGILRFDGTYFIPYNNHKVKNISFKDFLRYGKDGFIIFNNWEEDCVLIKDRTVQRPNTKVFRTFFIQNGKQYKRFYKNSFINNFYPDIDSYYIKTTSDTYFFNGKDVQYVTKKGIKKTISENFPLKLLGNSFECNDIVYMGDPENRRTILFNKGKISYDNQPSLYNDPKTKIYWHQGTKQIFIINDGNIYISKNKNGKPTLSFLMKYKKIEKELLYCMFYDEESDKMYFGNVVKGLNIISLSNFYVPQKNIPFTGEVVYEAQPFTQHSIITKQGFEFSRDKVSRLFLSNIKTDKRCLIYDNSSNLLYPEFNQIKRRYKNSQYKKIDSSSFNKRKVQEVFKIDKNYSVSMADPEFYYYYLYIYPDDKLKHPKNIFRFKSYIYHVFAVNNDQLYVSTDDGIYSVSISQHKFLKHFAKGLTVKQIQKTKDGNLWVLIYGKGIHLLRDNKLIAMPYDKNGYISNAHHILEDSHGFFWISSNNGLFKVAKNMLLEYSQNKDIKVTYYRYTKENGFLNNEFNGKANPSGNILENGDFVFPSMEGFVFFKPDEIKTYHPKSSQLFIERAKNGKNEIFFKDTLKLKSDYKTADIYFDFPYYHNIENIYLETRLENSENNNWEESKNGRKFILANVPPGNYFLHVRMLTSDKGKFTYKKIRIEIEPFFYQTLWFKILIVLVGLTIIVIIIQMRTNFLRITNEKLKSIVYNKDQQLKETSENLEITKTKLKNEAEYQQKIMESISHDITTPVRFISLMSQKLSETEDATIQKKYFDSIYKTSEQLFKFTLGLKEYNELYKEENTLDDEDTSIYEIVESKKLLFEQMALEHSTTIINICDPHVKLRTNKNILSAILHNLIDNAVKNTDNGEITIKAREENAQVEIGIFDTGKGMSPIQIEYYSRVFERVGTENFIFKNYGLGLHMVIQLSKKLEAKITFHENIPKGTAVKLFLKK